jgi:hypothetical protein
MEKPIGMSAQEMQMMGMTDPDELANMDPFDKAFIDAMIPHYTTNDNTEQEGGGGLMAVISVTE